MLTDQQIDDACSKLVILRNAGKSFSAGAKWAESEVATPLLARIAELEFNFKDMSERRTKYLEETVVLKERIAELMSRLQSLVPEGCKLVPVSPSANMVAAGLAYFKENCDDLFTTADHYRVMLAASPTESELRSTGNGADQSMATVLTYKEWIADSASCLAQFISLSSTPDAESWGHVAASASVLLNAEVPDFTSNAGVPEVSAPVYQVKQHLGASIWSDTSRSEFDAASGKKRVLFSDPRTNRNVRLEAEAYRRGATDVTVELKQLCQDFSDRQNRPYMKDVLSAVDSIMERVVDHEFGKNFLPAKGVLPTTGTEHLDMEQPELAPLPPEHYSEPMTEERVRLIVKDELASLNRKKEKS